jgi:hypothetical protein
MYAASLNGVRLAAVLAAFKSMDRDGSGAPPARPQRPPSFRVQSKLTAAPGRLQARSHSQTLRSGMTRRSIPTSSRPGRPKTRSASAAGYAAAGAGRPGVCRRMDNGSVSLRALRFAGRCSSTFWHGSEEKRERAAATTASSVLRCPQLPAFLLHHGHHAQRCE